MLPEIIHGSRAWRAETAGDPQGWHFELPERFVVAAIESINYLPIDFEVADYRPIEEMPLFGQRDALLPVREALERGLGFVILCGLWPRISTPAELTGVYYLVGQLLGRPVQQNIQGELLYHVRDTGQEVRYGARFSVTNAESTFHTDNSFGEVTDYVGLLCINAAKSGGQSQMVSGHAVHNELIARHPAALETLYQPFHVDRRGGARPGEPPTMLAPVFAWQEGELVCRYLRYWIEVGHEKAEQPLSTAQVAALDTLDGVLADPSLRVELALEPGDMYFINNRWLFHNRTAFEDHPEAQRRRHLVRLWLAKEEATNA